MSDKKQEYVYAVGFMTTKRYHIYAFFKDKGDAVKYASENRTLSLFEFPNLMATGEFTFFEFPNDLDYDKINNLDYDKIGEVK